MSEVILSNFSVSNNNTCNAKCPDIVVDARSCAWGGRQLVANSLRFAWSHSWYTLSCMNETWKIKGPYVHLPLMSPQIQSKVYKANVTTMDSLLYIHVYSRFVVGTLRGPSRCMLPASHQEHQCASCWGNSWQAPATAFLRLASLADHGPSDVCHLLVITYQLEYYCSCHYHWQFSWPSIN